MLRKPFKPKIAKYQTKSGGDGNQSPHANPHLKGASVCQQAVKCMGQYTNAGTKGKTVGRKLK